MYFVIYSDYTFEMYVFCVIFVAHRLIFNINICKYIRETYSFMNTKPSFRKTFPREVYMSPSIILLSLHRPLNLLETFSIEIEVDDFEVGEDL